MPSVPCYAGAVRKPVERHLQGCYMPPLYSSRIQILVLALIACATIPVGTLLAATPEDAAAQRALVSRYCATCHNEKLKTAGLLLDKANVENPSADGAIWETVLRKLRGNAMPPANAPKPEPAALKAFTNYLETSLDQAAAAHPNPGQIGRAHV